MTAFRVGRRFRRVYVFRLTFRIERSASERNRFSLRVEYRENQPPTKPVIRTALIFFNDQTALFYLLLSRALLTEMSRKRFPAVRSEAKLESLARLFIDAALL